VTEAKNKARAGVRTQLMPCASVPHAAGYQASRAAKSMFTAADGAMAAEARAAYAATQVPPGAQQDDSQALVQRSGNSGGAPVRRRQ